MGSAPSTRRDADSGYADHVSHDVMRALVPRGMQDEKAKELKYQLHWCLARNDWYFTIGGIVVGGALSLMAGSPKPFAAAVLLAPCADWMYGRTVCAEYEEAYMAYKKHLQEEYKKQIEEVKEQLGEHSSQRR